MANVENLEKKLEQLIIKNDKPFAIALTGDWGIGKTHLWKNFLDKNKSKLDGKKYAYVSLFGIESLDNLKLSIATDTHVLNVNDDSIFHKDILQPIKAMATTLTGGTSTSGNDVKVGVNVSNQLITSVILKHLTNTIVCIDDFERKSSKLSVSDILGLANYLKEERDCRVVLLLDENNFKVMDEKAEFRKYKEKVFDEVLNLDDNLSILKTFTEDTIALEVIERFYNTLKVKNLRFYLKVCKLYEEIISKSHNPSIVSMQNIIEQLLIIKWVDEINPVIPLNKDDDSITFTVDLNFLIKNFQLRDYRWNLSNDEIEKDKVLAFWAYINQFQLSFFLNEWGNFVAEHLKNHNFSDEDMQKLFEKDLLSESKLQEEREHQKIIDEYHSLEPKPNFIERFYYMALKQIGSDNLDNLTFYYNVLLKSNRSDYALDFRQKLEKCIRERVENSPRKPYSSQIFTSIPASPSIFRDYLDVQIDNYQPKNESLTEILIKLFREFQATKSWNTSDQVTLDRLNKENLAEIIWIDLEYIGERKYLIMAILNHPLLSLRKEEIRHWILELLNEKISQNPESRVPIQLWLEKTNNLTDLKA